MSSTDATSQSVVGVFAVSTAILLAGVVGVYQGDVVTAGAAAAVGTFGLCGGVVLYYADKRGVL
jgi:FtsH-binding integral membrane protein